jgi:amino acid adenylation domain-containing protein
MTIARDDIVRRRERVATRRAALSAEKQTALVESTKMGASRISKSAMIPPRPRGEPIPLSFAQERLWIWAQLNRDSVAYNMSHAAQITGRLNVNGISQSLNEIIRRHESLRTNFAGSDGQVEQIIAPVRKLELPIVDLVRLSEGEWEAEARRLASEDGRRPYNLDKDSLLRITLFKYEQRFAVLRAMHHIVSDAWSGEIFMRELVTLYKAYCAGEPSPLADLSLQFADYSYWQRHWLQGAALEAELSYWKQQLKGIQALDLPTDRPRSALLAYEASREVLTLSEKPTEELRTLSRQEGVTLYVLLLAALKILLSRYTGLQDIAVGTVLAGRNRMETEPLIGFFLNTMVLRTEFSRDSTIRDLIRRVREVFLEAQAHQDLPFEKLIEELTPDRGLGLTPLFQVMFSMSNAPQARGEDTSRTAFTDFGFGALGGKQQEVRLDEAKFDLFVTMAEMADRIGVSLEYNTDLFDRTTAKRLLRHYATLLEHMVADPDQGLATISLLSEPERHGMFMEWSNPVIDYRGGRCIAELFEMGVERGPDAVAVEDEDRQLTYRELNSRANQLANHLRRAGLTTESFVGVCMERSVDMIVGLWAIIKAGGAYVPMDPNLPKNRLRSMIEDSGAALVLSSRRQFIRIPADGVRVICVDADWEAIAEESNVNLCSQTDRDNAAYVIYTSGSTGNPKGVVASNAATVNRLEWMWEEYPFANDDICCQKTTIGFVDSIFEIFGPMLKGVRLSIIPEDTVKDPARLVAALSEKQVTRIVLVQTLLRMLFESGRDLQAELPALKFWVASGEYLGRGLAEDFLRLLPQRTLLNSYGSSEVSADAAFFDLNSWSGGATVPLGPPIANTSMYLLDRSKNPSPIGARGELHVGGIGLARGYLGRPGLTAEKFIPDHIGNNAGSRLYNTGDVARYFANGRMDFLGRCDFQVKIRGFRIELGEIEATLTEHPNVVQAVVIAGEGRSGYKRLMAYVVARQRGKLVAGDFISYLKRKLPDYMIPADLLILERMPLTPNGKVDRIALSKLDPDRSENKREYVPPRDLLETQLVQIWEKVLGVSPIGCADDFFSLGGTSLSAVRLVVEIDKQFGQTLTLNVIMQEGNIANLAKLLSKSAGPSVHPSLAVFRREGSRSPFFVVHSIGGEVLEYYQLSRLLGDDQPFYGLQSPLGVPAVDGNRSIEEMAGQYLEAVRSIQPEGPYLLGGFSWGGLVAFEMAQQLRRLNQRIALLAIVDSDPPYAVRVKPRIEDEASFLLKALRALAPADDGGVFPEAEQQELMGSGQPYRHALKLLKRWGIIDGGLGQEAGEVYIHSYVKGYMARIKAHGDYEAKVYPGKITFFRARPEPKKAHDWSRFSTEPLSIRDISGPHWSIMKAPHVQVLARQLRDCIDGLAELQSKIECA